MQHAAGEQTGINLKFIPEFCAVFVKIPFNFSQYHESFVTAPVR